MKEQYRWNYNIKIKTKEGTYEYEDVPLEDMTLLVLKHPEYTELQAKQNKGKVKKIGTNNKHNTNR